MTSRLLRGAAALALTAPLTVAAVAAPAAAVGPVLADRWWPGPPAGAGQLATLPIRTTLDTSVATDSEATGLVTVSSSVTGGTAAGTGIVLGSDGLVVTNHHVVEGATSVSVTVVTTGATYVADVLGTDATKDVAVLRLEDAAGLSAATTSAGTLADGDAVTAVGDAGGDGGTLTAAPGQVTDLHHAIAVTDETTGEQTPLRNLVEVSSDIISGDSGGALLDADGDVVGMNVAASSGAADVTGYVIPIGRVLRIVDTVLAGADTATVAVGESARIGAYLGVGLVGTTVAEVVEGSPAAALGLAAGDTVTAVDGVAVASADALVEQVQSHAAGDALALAWADTAGAAHSGTATLDPGPVA